MHRDLPARQGARIVEERLLFLRTDLEHDRAAVGADEVVVPDGQTAPRIRHVLVHPVVRLARGRSLGRQCIDEIAATAHDFQFYDFASPETRAMLARMAT